MKNRLLSYLNKVTQILNEDASDRDWNELLAEHLHQISFFQHERLVHLIVTATFGFLMFLTLNLLFFTDEFRIFLLMLFIGLAGMLVLYILHYYVLETNVQRLYIQYDEILRKRTKSKSRFSPK